MSAFFQNPAADYLTVKAENMSHITVINAFGTGR